MTIRRVVVAAALSLAENRARRVPALEEEKEQRALTPEFRAGQAVGRTVP